MYAVRCSAEFLQRIDTTHELGSYEADKAELVEEMVWQRRGAGDFSFDPETYYPEMNPSVTRSQYRVAFFVFGTNQPQQ